MQLLRQNSGSGAGSGVTISLGPCLDSTGAEYTGLVIGDLTIVKNGTSAAMASAATLTHNSNGHYDLVTIGNNADTSGRLRIRCNKSGYQIPPLEFMVLPATVYDAHVTNATNTNGGLLAATSPTTVNANIGTASASTAQTGDAYVIVNNNTYGNSKLKDAITNVDDDLSTVAGSVTDIQVRLPAELANGLMKSDVQSIDGNAEAAEKLKLERVSE
jgi:hypothetical protein